MKFALTEKDGTRKVYRLKPFDELTLKDWGMLQGEPLSDNPHEALVEMVCRLTTIPKAKLKRLAVGEFDKLLGVMADNVGAMNAAKRKDPHTSFQFQGDTYTIPHDLESVGWDQWHTLVEVRWPKCEREEELYAYSLAILCTKEGEDFGAVDVEQRKALFMDLPLPVSLGACAFFFDRSQRFRNALSHCMNSLMTSKLRSAGQARSSSERPTAVS